MNKKNKIIIMFIVVISVVLLGLVVFFLNMPKEKNVTYDIIFDSNGGSEVQNQIINHGELVQKPSDPTKDDYIFVEWTYQDLTYDFSLEVTKELTLVAKWVEVENDVQTFIIKFNSDGGTTISNQIIEKGNKIEKPIDPIKKGYKFQGWILNDKIYDFESAVENDIELKAKWEELKETNNNGSIDDNPKPTTPVTPTVKKYTVTFNSNGGSAVSSQTITEGNKFIKPSDPTRTNYLFNGWFIGDKKYNFDNIASDNITLNANWILYGDVNQDGKINMADALEIEQYCEGKVELTELQKKVADVNLDGLVNTIDVDIITKYYVDKEGYGISKLPYDSGEIYQISYELNGGTVKQQNIKNYAQISLTYTLKNPTKEDSVFLGWTGSNGNTPEVVVTIPKNTIGNLNYIANWILYGDVNQDGKINMADALEIKQYCEGKVELTELQKKVADVNLDGLVNTIDVDIITKYYVDKEGYGIPKLPHIS